MHARIRLVPFSLFFITMLCPSVFGYTILDRSELADAPRMWRPGLDGKIQYQVAQQHNSALAYFVNNGTEPAHFDFVIGGFNDAPLTVNLKPGERNAIPVKLLRIDQGLSQAQMHFFESGSGQRMPLPALQETVPTFGFYVSMLQEEANFNPSMLAYFVKKKEDGIAEVHFRNHSKATLHFDYWIVGYQDRQTARNPRLSVEPMQEIELLTPLPTLDARVGYAIVEIYNIRVGDKDEGELLSPLNAVNAGSRFIKDPDWSYVAMIDDDAIDFNPYAIVHRIERKDGFVTAVTLRNLSSKQVNFDFILLNRQPMENHGNPRVQLQAGQTQTIPIRPIEIGNVPLVHITQLKIRVGSDTGPFAGERYPARPPRPEEVWLMATAWNGDPLFSTKTIGYVTRKLDTKQAEVKFRNLGGAAVSFDFELAGYPSATKPPRITLAPGEMQTVALALERTDVRLAIAKLLVSNVRIGDESQVLLAERKAVQ